MRRPSLIAALVAALLSTRGLIAVGPASAQGAFDTKGGCVGDQDGDGVVDVEELVAAVNNALAGCQFQQIVLNFRAMVGERAFACGETYSGIGTSSADIVPSDFRFYVHDIRLVTSGGDEVPLSLEQDGLWQNGDVALLDFENRVRPCNTGTSPIHTSVRGMVPPGVYTGVRFALGVPFARNHLDTATSPSPLNLSGMFWSWQDGYKFLRIDTAFDNFRMHLGSTGCFYEEPGILGGCARPNRPQISLSSFDPTRSVIVADLAALLAESDLDVNQPNTPPGCMSDPGDGDCTSLFRNLGLSFTDGSPTPQTQKFFRLE